VLQLATLAPQLFEELTVSHITRRLELNDDKLDLFLHGEVHSHHIRKTPLNWMRRNSAKEEKVAVIEYPSSVLNAICKLVLSLSNPQDMQAEGLFRKSGNMMRQKELATQIMEDCCMDLTPYTTHDRATVIKQLIANFHEPLLLARHFEAFKQAVGESISILYPPSPPPPFVVLVNHCRVCVYCVSLACVCVCVCVSQSL
jgi:hypothetical protein